MRFGTLVQSLAVSSAEPSVSDAELLARFAQRGDGAAFELLVRRHAELVWRVCRSELPGDTHSAEDAFQTTFLVLARKAGSVRESTVAGYLFRVARNAAFRVRKRIGTVAESTVEVGVEPAEPDGGSVALIEEVERLPDKFRLPVLLCFFEDCTHVEAANRLGLAVGTVASRLARAKDRLRIRLTHRGLALPAVLAGAGVPAATVRAAATMAMTPSAVPTLLTELTREVLIVMALTKAKWIGGGVLAALLLTGGLGLMVLTAGPTHDEPKPVVPGKPGAKAPEKAEAAELKKFQGRWRVTKIENNRGVAPAKEIETMRWEFTGNTIIGQDRPDQLAQDKMQFTFDATKSPKQITITGKAAPDAKADRTIGAIYEIEGDTLRICMGDTRPTEFKVEKGVDGGLIELERIPDGIRELKDLAGEWTVAADGPDDTGTVDIYRDVMWMTHGDKTEKAIITLDAEKGFLDITAITGPIAVRGKPMLGRFTWKDNKLSIYTGGLGAERPAEAKAGKGVTVAVMERIKKK